MSKELGDFYSYYQYDILCALIHTTYYYYLYYDLLIKQLLPGW